MDFVRHLIGKKKPKEPKQDDQALNHLLSAGEEPSTSGIQRESTALGDDGSKNIRTQSITDLITLTEDIGESSTFLRCDNYSKSDVNIRKYVVNRSTSSQMFVKTNRNDKTSLSIPRLNESRGKDTGEALQDSGIYQKSEGQQASSLNFLEVKTLSSSQSESSRSSKSNKSNTSSRTVFITLSPVKTQKNKKSQESLKSSPQKQEAVVEQIPSTSFGTNDTDTKTETIIVASNDNVEVVVRGGNNYGLNFILYNLVHFLFIGFHLSHLIYIFTHFFSIDLSVHVCVVFGSICGYCQWKQDTPYRRDFSVKDMILSRLMVIIYYLLPILVALAGNKYVRENPMSNTKIFQNNETYTYLDAENQQDYGN